MSRDPETLIDGYFDGLLSDAEAAELFAWVREDRVHARAFARATFVHAQIRAELSGSRLAEQFIPAALPSRRRWMQIGIAASVLCIAGLGWWWSTSSAASRLVTVVESVDAVWSSSAAPRKGDGFGRARLSLASGLVNLAFPSGASIVVQGPAQFEIVSPNSIRFSSGVATVDAPQGAERFRVETPAFQVTDSAGAYGFAVAQNSGESRLCAFSGQVDLREAGSAGYATSLREGEAVRGMGGEFAAVAFSAAPFERAWPVQLGVLSTTGAVRFAPAGPRDLTRLRTWEHLMLFQERHSVLLPRQVQVDIAAPGVYRRDLQWLSGSRLRAGTGLRSYLLHFEPNDADEGRSPSKLLQGTVTFSRPILGVIVSDRRLTATDKLLGARDVIYPKSDRGLEGERRFDGSIRELPDDVVTLSADRRTLTVSLRVHMQKDQLRILVEDPANQLVQH